MATSNPIKHYKLDCGLLKVGCKADITVVDNLKDFNVLETWINGKKVAEKGKILFKVKPLKGKNKFILKKKLPKDFDIKTDKKNSVKVKVIEIIQNQIITKKSEAELKIENGNILPDVKKDILKICVAERYGKNNLSVAFVKGFKIKNGVIASSVSHDSHNIIAVGTDEKLIAKAVNAIREMKGGLIVIDKNIVKVSLTVAGLMTKENPKKLNKKLSKLFDYGKKICGFNPFPTLSFLALLVIPELKLSDGGLFDVNKFSLVDLES
jgi:adenine deaminase